MGATPSIAVVFADRLGRELDPLFKASCPALLPIAGKTPLEYCLDDLAEVGIRRAVIVVSACAERIQALLGNGDAWGLQFEFVLSRGEEAPAALVKRFDSLLDEHYLAVRGDVLRSPLARDFLAQWAADPAETQALVQGRPVGMAVSSRAAPELGAVAWPLAQEASGTSLEAHKGNPLASLEDIWQANLDAVAGAFHGLVIPGLSKQSGVVVGRLSYLETSSVVEPPVHVGDHSSVHRSCGLYGPVVIGNNCFIDRETQISNSVILPGTYIGAGLDVQDAIVGEGQLIKPLESLVLQVDDPLWVAPMEQGYAASDRSLIDRLLALVLLLLSAPLWPVAALLSRSGKGRALRHQAVLGNRRGVRGQRLEVDLRHWMTAVPVLRQLPGLLAVCSGDLRMFGAAPRPAGEATGLAAELAALQGATEQPPAGLISAARLQLPADAPPEEVELFEIVFAAERSARKELQCWWLAFKGLFSGRAWSSAPRAGTASETQQERG